MIRTNSFSDRWNLAAAVVGVCVALTGVATGCGGDEADMNGKASVSEGRESAASSAAFIEGVVKETMDSGGYTYVFVDGKDGPAWAAGPVTPMAVGQEVRIATSMPMEGFHSDTLDRTFDTLYFVSSFDATGDTGGPEAVAPGSSDRTTLEKEVATPVEKAPGGLSVAEIYAGRADLAGKSVLVRGTVVKFSPGIMGTNWLHLQDGTCDGESCDLAVTTNEAADVGAIVTVQGVLAVDKDFGAGYRYEVIVEGATIQE